MTRRRSALATTLVLLGLMGGCVDLFHETNFRVLCDDKPQDPRCGDGQAASDATVEIDAPSDAPRSEIDFCTLTSRQARDAAIRVCAFLGACGGPLGDRAFGDCVVSAQLAFDCTSNPVLRPAGAARALWSCMFSARACVEVERCLYGPTTPSCPAIATGSFTTCIPGGAVRIECSAPGGSAPSGVDPCALRARRCLGYSPSAADCVGRGGYSCNTTTCDGTGAVDCQPVAGGTVDQGVDCAVVGASSCVSGDTGPACAPSANAGACPTTTGVQPVCVDGGATSCVAGKAIVIDCASLGLTCEDSASAPSYDPTVLCRAPPGDFCSARDMCFGDVLRGCGRGQLYEADCVKLGLGPCTTKNNRTACAKP